MKHEEKKRSISIIATAFVASLYIFISKPISRIGVLGVVVITILDYGSINNRDLKNWLKSKVSNYGLHTFMRVIYAFSSLSILLLLFKVTPPSLFKNQIIYYGALLYSAAMFLAYYYQGLINKNMEKKPRFRTQLWTEGIIIVFCINIVAKVII